MPRSAVSKTFPYLVAVSAALFLVPQETQKLDFRTIGRPLEIKIDKSSPAFSALEDTRVSYVDHPSFRKYDSATDEILKSGRQDPPETIQNIVLRPQVISSFTKLSHVSDIRDRKLRIARAYVEENPPAPAFEALAQKLVSAELVKQTAEQEQKTLPSGVIVSRPTNKRDPNSPIFIAAAELTGRGKGLAPSRRTVRSQETSRYQSNGPSTSNVFSGSQTSSSISATYAGYDIGQVPARGKVTFTKGAAYIRGYDQMVITHGYGDIKITEGVWIEKDGQFEVPIEKINGEINAKVYSRDGVLTAEGQIHLADLKIDIAKEKKLENLELILAPARDGVEAIVLAAESRGLPFRTNLTNADAEILGFGRMSRDTTKKYLAANDLRRPSSVILEASLDSFWSSIKFGFSGQRNVINIFSNTTISTFLNIIEQYPDSRNIKDRNIAWGSLYKDGRPLENAVVDLAFNEDEEVVYFSGPIPDRMRVMTDNNGQFAILNKNPGLQLLKVQQIGEKILPVLVAFQPKAITDLNLEISNERLIEFQSADIFSGQPKAVEFNFLGDDDVFACNEYGYASLNRRTIEGLTLAEFDAGPDYLMTRVGFNHHSRLVSAPMIPRKWVEDNLGPAQSEIIVGRVSGEDYEVSLEILTGNAGEVKITYFNPDGKVRSERYGTADGTYIITGAPAGLQTVTVSSIRTGKLISSVVLVDDRAAHYTFTNLSI